LSKVLKRAAAYALAIAISALAAEVAAAAYAYAKLGEFVWMRLIRSATPTASSATTDRAARTRMKLFPYTGYALRPGWTVEETGEVQKVLNMMGLTSRPGWLDYPANNFGFLARFDYPAMPSDPSTFYVGVAGGSVANGLALAGEAAIREAVRSVQGFENRRVEIVNFASGGFKQPQHAITLSYLLSLGQRFDLLINLDGFNEAYIGWENMNRSGASIDMPTAIFLFGLQNHFLSASSDAPNKVRAARREATRLKDEMARTASGLRYFQLLLRARNLVAEEVKVENEVGGRVPGRDYPIVVQPAQGLDAEAMAETIADIWVRGSLQMQALARQFGIPYIHAIQPNQYFDKRGPIMSAAEKAVAFSDPPHPAKALVPAVYGRMVARAPILAAAGIRFRDATPAFDDVADPLYFDTCCHFNQRGYDVLMERVIAPAIRDALRRAP